jgi:hypothetical protein
LKKQSLISGSRTPKTFFPGKKNGRIEKKSELNGTDEKLTVFGVSSISAVSKLRSRHCFFYLRNM